MSQYTAWEPIPIVNKETCGTCRHLNATIGYLTNPIQYRCKLSGKLHFRSDECDIPSLLKDGDTE